MKSCLREALASRGFFVVLVSSISESKLSPPSTFISSRSSSSLYSLAVKALRLTDFFSFCSMNSFLASALLMGALLKVKLVALPWGPAELEREFFLLKNSWVASFLTLRTDF